MNIDEALALNDRLIFTGEVHQDYERTVKLAEDYKIFITGCGIDKKLRKFARREDDEMFKQRLEITKSTTPAVASSLRQPVSKVVRNDRIRKDVGVKTEAIKKRVETMVKSFYGNPRKKNSGLEYWFKTKFVSTQMLDPNAWLVMEWKTPQKASEVLKPYPFLVKAAAAKNFKVENDEVKWLFIEETIKYKGKGEATANTGVPAPANPNNAPGFVEPFQPAGTIKQGKRFTLYDADLTVVYEQVDENYTVQEGETVRKIKEFFYVVRTFTPRLGYPPAFRMGYKEDDDTDGRTFVNFWHDALCYFEKSLKTVSELDLTMTMHAFPQKLQYVQQCPGTKTRKCTAGKVIADGTTCGVCKGTGFRNVVTTTQDAILVPMPSQKDEQLDLDKILVYKAPPIDIVKFQNDYCQQLERQAHQAVYNSQIFVKKSTSATQTGGGGVQTATEQEYNMQSVYDALEPLTEKQSELWKDIVTTFGILAGAKITELNPVHEFPADFKLKTGDVLLAERKTAIDSGAPPFLIDSIDCDIAANIYEGDDLAMNKFRVFSRYKPFSGKSPDEIAVLFSSQWVPEEIKVLYANFDLIFKEIEKETPGFFTNTTPGYRQTQDEIVKKKVEEVTARVKSQQPELTVNSLRNTNPANQKQDNPADE